jgi:hypothetical protein
MEGQSSGLDDERPQHTVFAAMTKVRRRACEALDKGVLLAGDLRAVLGHQVAQDGPRVVDQASLQNSAGSMAGSVYPTLALQPK